MDGKSSSQKQVSLKRSGVEVPRLSELAAEWQTKKYGEQIQDQVLKDKILIRIKEATALIKDSASKQEGVGGDHVYRMEWDQLYDISANVMDEYTKNVDTILTQLDQLYRKLYLWQESVFLKDSQTGATVVGRAEEWMKLKEHQLDRKGAELDRSASAIKCAIERLTAKD